MFRIAQNRLQKDAQGAAGVTYVPPWHETQYLQALTSFTKPARQLCRVTWAGDEHYGYEWAEEANTWFRYMDLTACAEFGLRMA